MTLDYSVHNHSTTRNIPFQWEDITQAPDDSAEPRYIVRWNPDGLLIDRRTEFLFTQASDDDVWTYEIPAGWVMDVRTDIALPFEQWLAWVKPEFRWQFEDCVARIRYRADRRAHYAAPVATDHNTRGGI